MAPKNKLVSAMVIIITSILASFDIVLFGEGIKPFFSHFLHCSTEGIIILMFSREMRGDSNE
jgi:hypothetical protein